MSSVAAAFSFCAITMSKLGHLFNKRRGCWMSQCSQRLPSLIWMPSQNAAWSESLTHFVSHQSYHWGDRRIYNHAASPWCSFSLLMAGSGMAFQVMLFILARYWNPYNFLKIYKAIGVGVLLSAHDYELTLHCGSSCPFFVSQHQVGMLDLVVSFHFEKLVASVHGVVLKFENL